jgi:hypothetical protein
MIIEHAVKMEFTPGKDFEPIACLGKIEISDDDRGRFYLTTQSDQTIAVDIPDVFIAIQKAILAAQ